MNKIIAAGKIKKKPEAGGWTFLEKVRNLRYTWVTYSLTLNWEDGKDQTYKINILRHFIVPKVSFGRSYFYDFLTEACADKSVKVRMAAVDALNGSGYLNDDSSKILREVLEKYISSEEWYPHSEDLRLFYDIRNELDLRLFYGIHYEPLYKISRMRVALDGALLKIEKPGIEDFHYLVKQVKVSIEDHKKHVFWDTPYDRGKRILITSRGNLALQLIKKMDKNHITEKHSEKLILLLFEAVGILRENLIKKIYPTLSCPNNNRMNKYLKNIFDNNNNPLAKEMAKFYLNKERMDDHE